MRERKLSQAIRCSLENFGEFDYIDGKAAIKREQSQACLDSAEREQARLKGKAEGAVRHVRIFPLYAIRRIS